MIPRTYTTSNHAIILALLITPALRSVRVTAETRAMLLQVFIRHPIVACAPSRRNQFLGQTLECMCAKVSTASLWGFPERQEAPPRPSWPLLHYGPGRHWVKLIGYDPRIKAGKVIAWEQTSASPKSGAFVKKQFIDEDYRGNIKR